MKLLPQKNRIISQIISQTLASSIEIGTAKVPPCVSLLLKLLPLHSYHTDIFDDFHCLNDREIKACFESWSKVRHYQVKPSPRAI